MTTPRGRYLSRVYEMRYGVVGRVARIYVEAGYSVEFMHPTRYGPIHIIARGNGHKLAIEVFDKPSTVPIEVVNRLLDKAKLISAKPILILYSSGPRLGEDVRSFCIENNIRVKRFITD